MTEHSDTMFRVAILSFWHVHAEDYACETEEHPNAEIVAIWDEDPERGEREATRRNVSFHEDLETLLARDDIDGVVVTTPTTDHGKVIPAAARAGKHVFTEKVLATTLRESQEIAAEAEASGVVLVVSMPRLYVGYTSALKKAIDERAIGDVTYLRVRVSHDGALPSVEHSGGWLPERFFEHRETGGGVQIDFGAHPLYLIQHLLGPPESITSIYGHFTGRPTEDNAAAVLRYPNGAIGIAESSFLGSTSPFIVEAHGTEGSLIYDPAGGLSLRRAGESSPETLEIPSDGPSPFSRWVGRAIQGELDPSNIKAALELSALAEAAGASAAENRVVPLEESS